MTELPKVEPYGHTDNDFADKYRAYKDYVQSASAALQKKDYATAITNYSKAIEMSPFEINNYCNRGIAYYKSGKDAAIVNGKGRCNLILHYLLLLKNSLGFPAPRGGPTRPSSSINSMIFAALLYPILSLLWIDDMDTSPRYSPNSTAFR